jgi:Zn-dependent M28 family amino/carboxypeptidase
MLVAAVVLASCSSPPVPVSDLGRDLAGRVTVDGMVAHLRKLQDIANANKGSRADGTAGYDASVDYVAKILRDKGFDVQTPEFDRLGISRRGNPGLTVAGRRYPADQASLLLSTAPGGLNAITLRPKKPAGCVATDYDGVDVKSAIAVVDDAGCSVVQKQDVATAKGAVGLLVVSQPGGNGSPASLFTPGYYQQLKVPVGVIGTDADGALRRTTARVQLTLDTKATMMKSRNVVAQTKSGDTHNVVMAGAHLDSVAAGPSINDDGSAVAALLETALALGSQPHITNAVRLGFWGSEPGLEGSTKYVRGLSQDQIKDIGLYLNFDSLGSTNAGFFTYDGDQSGQPNPAVPSSTVPQGSAGIERTLAGFLSLAGARPADMPLSTSVDYSPFLSAGVPIGGTTAGASQRKTDVQARLWGGRAGLPFDPNYRTPLDNIDNIDNHALSVMGPAAAFAIGTYAQSIDGVNGVPQRDRRTRVAP